MGVSNVKHSIDLSLSSSSPMCHPLALLVGTTREEEWVFESGLSTRGMRGKQRKKQKADVRNSAGFSSTKNEKHDTRN